MGLTAVLVMVTLPGIPGAVRSARFTTHVTCACTVALFPAVVVNPSVATVTLVDAQLSPLALREKFATLFADRCAAEELRSMDAARAAS